jgi:pimeloyl-ACP methyl ester carboxylesterase
MRPAQVRADEDRYADIAGLRIRFRERGGNAAGGAPLLLLHGIGSGIEHWASVFEGLGARHHVIALDLPGFGRSDKPDPRGDRARYTLGWFAGHVRAFLDARGIARARVVGLSLGGGVALTFARLFPDRLAALGLICSAGLGRRISWHFRFPTLPGVGEAMALFRSRGTAKWFLRSVVHEQACVTDALVDLHLDWASAPGAAAAFLATLRRHVALGGVRREVTDAVASSLPGIFAPTLVVWGREDPVLPLAEAERGARLLPRASLRVIERCGHLPPLERPRELNEILEALLPRG